MEPILDEYEKSLKELEQEKQKLETVVKMMGQEWEQSGAGIKWLNLLNIQGTKVAEAEQAVLNITHGSSTRHPKLSIHSDETLLEQSDLFELEKTSVDTKSSISKT